VSVMRQVVPLKGVSVVPFLLQIFYVCGRFALLQAGKFAIPLRCVMCACRQACRHGVCEMLVLSFVAPEYWV